MTGGVAFLLDEGDGVQQRLNPGTVILHSLSTTEQEGLLKPLLEAHLAHTGSSRAATILADWANWKTRFKVVVPPSEMALVGLATLEPMAV
jgi:glutamate synthase (ferredoxin)